MVIRVTENIATFPAQLIGSTRRRKTVRVSIFGRQLLRDYTNSCILSEWQTNPLSGSALRLMTCVRSPMMRARRLDFSSGEFRRDVPLRLEDAGHSRTRG